MKRVLGRSGIEVSALGLGCWAIGGPWWYVGEAGTDEPSPSGWGIVDDEESIRAIHAAIDHGVTFFDTADAYGCGHSERVLGKALADRRDQAVIATKFGKQFDEASKHYFGHKTSPALIRSACEASLRRLDMDTIDLYQFHWGDYPAEEVGEVLDTLDDLVEEGKIRWYGWSTDTPDRARAFARGEHCTAIQMFLSVLYGPSTREMLATVEDLGLASINKGPLAMGIATGKFTAATTFGANDIRSEWDLRDGRGSEMLKKMEQIRGVLASDGRTPAQGALGWIWACSEQTIPIPGFKNAEQAIQNARAMDFGPLTTEQMREIDEILEPNEETG